MVLGQTVRSSVYKNHERDMRYVEGDLSDNALEDGDIFGDNFTFNQYGNF